MTASMAKFCLRWVLSFAGKTLQRQGGAAFVTELRPCGILMLTVGAAHEPDPLPILIPLAPAPPPLAAARRSCPSHGTGRWRQIPPYELASAGQAWHRGCRGRGGNEPGVGAC